MSESAEVISNADASYGTDTETLPDVDIQNPIEVNDKTENKSKDIIRETADNVHSCRVCYDEYHTSRNQARVLGCGHTFCTRCVISCTKPNSQNLLEVGSGIKCPECRKICEQAPATVPVNFQLMQILAVLSLVKEPLTPEQEKEMPQYENFDRLGSHIPTSELADLSIHELYEHMKAVLCAIGIRCKRDKETAKPVAVLRYEQELRKFEDAERTLIRGVHTMTRLKNGDTLRDWSSYSNLSFPWFHPPDRDNIQEREAVHDNDWMREMVVYRPNNVPPHRVRPPFAGILPLNAPPVQDVDAVHEREQAARIDADPSRNVHVVREALLRRERESAHERETANRNEQFMRQLLERNDQISNAQLQQIHTLHMARVTHASETRQSEIRGSIQRAIENDRAMENLRRQENGEHPLLGSDDVTVDTDEDDESEASDDSSFIEEPVTRPQPLPMTIGEAISIYRLVEVFSPRHLRLGLNSFVLPNDHPNLDSLARELLPEGKTVMDHLDARSLQQVSSYCNLNQVDCDRLLRNLRQHTIRFAPTVVESPRVVHERRRRQRPAPADDYNARLTVIRRRAKEALRGNTPEKPLNGEESNLTIRLIVNLASSMGVRDKLDEIICPQHRAKEEEKELFVPRRNASTRQEMLFCTACRCEVPMGSKQIHSQGRRHITNLANRPQSRQRH